MLYHYTVHDFPASFTLIHTNLSNHPGHGCSPEADMGPQASAQPLPIVQLLCWTSHMLTETMNCLPGVPNNGLTILHTYLPLQSVDQWQLVTGTAALPCHLITTVGQDQAHFNVHQSYHCEDLPCSGFLSHHDWPS